MVPTAYDPLISKVIAWAPDRAGAMARMIRALDEYDVRGIKTTIGFCRQLIASEAFASADVDTTTVDRLLLAKGSEAPISDERDAEAAAMAAALWMVRQDLARRKRSTATPDRPESFWARQARTDGLR